MNCGRSAAKNNAVLGFSRATKKAARKSLAGDIRTDTARACARGLARSVDASRAVQHFRALARELNVVLPVSFFESAGRAFFNSVAIVDADGAVLGVYRKAHIPNGPGYQEKNYFSPGDTGFKVWDTRFARIGVGICWDQWFPESARIMALLGAELLFFPTAIGSEPPPALPLNSREHWQRAQQGQAAANLVPLIASNRYGLERSLQNPDGLYIRFYGSSFIADATGAKVAEAPAAAEKSEDNAMEVEGKKRKGGGRKKRKADDDDF